ncbi:putative nucleotide-binding alpha-beta plait domain-containing protein [Medicago truncatula]|uniref:Heterogeneous nuclear ribonucleoprotein n=1 Tax=Medicago truncatula TaxID=3880 RepID=G7JPR0_MEDTR|nr:UBP1-associated protein 2C [Medicago truncatula]AES90335.2 heterogeneous nuclear ribonucleoprotein [Medicago truncatula]RHN62299.1 putative nucleotide-binding alpha-beta plait domain-containing protein [Medicago truncatula]
MEFKKRKTEENGDANSPPSSIDAAVIPPALTSDDIRKILQPFTQEQLLDLLQSASLQHPDILDAVRSVADRDTTRRKLFVRGLSGETTTETLRTVFSSYGDLDEAIVIFDKATGRSKGYGFVVYRHVDGAVLALKEPSKKIDGRMTVTQLAAAGSTGGDVSSRKVFVGNVPFEVSAESLLSEFSKYGEIEEGPLGFDKASGKTRGFAFFVYKTEEGAKNSVAESMKTVDGHQVICKFAVDNKKPKPVGQNPSGFPVDNSNVNYHPPNPTMMPPQYGAPPNSYVQQPYGNQVPAAGGYGPGPVPHYGGPVAGPGPVPGPRGPQTAVGGYPDGSQYGYPQQPMPVQRPPPGGMYQPYY